MEIVSSEFAEEGEFRRRIEALQDVLKSNNLDGALFFNAEEIFYFTGTGVHSVLYIPCDRDPILLIRINWQKGREDTFIRDVRTSSGVSSLAEVIEELYGNRRLSIGIPFDVINIKSFHTLKKLLPSITFVDVQPMVWSLRLIKSPWEISQIKLSAAISREGLNRLHSLLKPGVSEIQLQKLIELETFLLGDEGHMVQRGTKSALSFGVVASGPNTAIMSGYWMTMTGSGRSAIRPYGAGDRLICEGDFVIIDKGTVYKGYHADEARTFVCGKASSRQKDLHRVLNDILDVAIAKIRPGVTAAEVYLEAEKTAKAYGYEEEFMGLEQYGFRYVGHGVGLEIDEPPLISAFNHHVLEPGMVIAIEPKLIFRDNYGLTMEDTVVVTNNGCQVLTQFERDILEIGGGG